MFLLQESLVVTVRHLGGSFNSIFESIAGNCGVLSLRKAVSYELLNYCSFSSLCFSVILSTTTLFIAMSNNFFRIDYFFFLVFRCLFFWLQAKHSNYFGVFWGTEGFYWVSPLLVQADLFSFNGQILRHITVQYYEYSLTQV